MYSIFLHDLTNVQCIYDNIFVAKNMASLHGKRSARLLCRNNLDRPRLFFISMQRRLHHIEKLRDILGNVTNEVSTRECNQGGVVVRWTELRDVKPSPLRREIVTNRQINEVNVKRNYQTCCEFLMSWRVLNELLKDLNYYVLWKNNISL